MREVRNPSFPRTKITGQSFFIASPLRSGWFMALPHVVICTAKKVSLISSSLSRQGNSRSSHTVADCAGLQARVSEGDDL